MASTLAFKPAQRRQARARIGLAGPSGSGKTWTALQWAAVLGQSIAVIDTEHGSASLYADEVPFQVLELQSFEPRTLVEALAVAGHANHQVVVVDSLSAFWSGSGGMLEQVDHAAKRSAGGNSFGGWKEARPMEREMIDALLAYPGHVIVTMRTKTEWVVDTDERTGKKVPRKIGTKPEQREGIEYELAIVGDLDLEHTLVISKSRMADLADAVIRRPGRDVAERIAAWLAGGEALDDNVPAWVDRAIADTATLDDLRALHDEVKAAQMLGAAVMPDGIPTTLGELIVRKGHEARAREKASTPA